MVFLFQTMYILHYMIRYTNTITCIPQKYMRTHMFITTYTNVSYTYVSYTYVSYTYVSYTYVSYTYVSYTYILVWIKIYNIQLSKKSLQHHKYNAHVTDKRL